MELNHVHLSACQSLWPMGRDKEGDLCTEKFLRSCATVVGLGPNPTSAINICITEVEEAAGIALT